MIQEGVLKEVPLVEGSKPVQKYHWDDTVGCIASGVWLCLSLRQAYGLVANEIPILGLWEELTL